MMQKLIIKFIMFLYFFSVFMNINREMEKKIYFLPMHPHGLYFNLTPITLFPLTHYLQQII